MKLETMIGGVEEEEEERRDRLEAQALGLVDEERLRVSDQKKEGYGFSSGQVKQKSETM